MHVGGGAWQKPGPPPNMAQVLLAGQSVLAEQTVAANPPSGASQVVVVAQVAVMEPPVNELQQAFPPQSDAPVQL
jgi:hypothetical protein